MTTDNMLFAVHDVNSGAHAALAALAHSLTAAQAHDLELHAVAIKHARDPAEPDLRWHPLSKEQRYARMRIRRKPRRAGR